MFLGKLVKEISYDVHPPQKGPPIKMGHISAKGSTADNKYSWFLHRISVKRQPVFSRLRVRLDLVTNGKEYVVVPYFSSECALILNLYSKHIQSIIRYWQDCVFYN